MILSLLDQIKISRVIPLMALEDITYINVLVDLLVKAGLPICEIGLRNENAFEALKILSSRNDIFLGAGTVLNKNQAIKAINCGANFIVSPGLDEELILYCLSRNIPIFPGTSSPSDIQKAFNLGLKVVKLFPVEQLGGVEYLKALAAAFREMKFIPTGGINANNIFEYLKLDYTFAVGGSWMLNPKLYLNNNFDNVYSECKRTLDIVEGINAKY